MKEKFSVVEQHGRYFLYVNDQEYVTPCFFNISSYDKGLVEAIGRKVTEGKPNLVKLYLNKYDNAELVQIIRDLAAVDHYWARYEITNNQELCAKVFKDIQLRKLIDAYSECGSINMSIDVATSDMEDSFDPFLAGMAVTSGLYMSPEGEAADIYYNELCDIFQDRFDRDIRDELSTDFLEEFVLKYNAILLPKGPRARSKFEEVLDELSKLQVRVEK